MGFGRVLLIPFFFFFFFFFARASDALAQPYGWFAVTNAITLINLANGATVFSQSAPAGVVLGEGAVNPATGEYLAVANVGTFRLRASPPYQMGQLSIRGNILRVSVDGAYALVGLRRLDSIDWALVQLPSGTEVARYTNVADAQFDATGVLAVIYTTTSGGTASYAGRRYLLTAPTAPLWTIDTGTDYPRLAGNVASTAVVSGTTLRTVDATTGLEQRRISVDLFAKRLIVRGNDVYLAFASEVVKYDLRTLDRLARGEAYLLFPRSIELSGDGRQLFAYSSVTLGGRFATTVTQLVAYDARDLRVLTSRTTPPGDAYMSVDTETSCLFGISPQPGLWGAGIVTAPARGGVLSFSVTADHHCQPWNISLSAAWDRILIGPRARTGPSTVLLAVPPRNTILTRELHDSLSIEGVSYVIDQALETQLPSAPVDARVTHADGSATVTWSVTDGADITGFRIEAGFVGGPVQLVIARPPEARAWKSPAIPSGNYFVQVRAVNAVGNSAPTDPINFTVAPSQPPAAPTNLRATVRDSYVNLMWDAAGLPSASHFVIEAGAPGSPRSVIGRTPDARTTFALPAAPPGTWEFAVVAVNDAGSARSNVTTVTSGACSGAPTLPTAFEAIVTGNVVTLGWNIPASGASAVVVEVGSAPGLTDITRLIVPTQFTRIDQEAPRGAYVVRLRGVNACGLSAVSVEKSSACDKRR